ncbi:MAG: RNA polymerase sigma factor [Ekhidna sp.]
MQKSICEDQVFREVHSSHELPLRNFLFYKLGNLEKAKDFAQEAFVRLWNNCSKVALEKAKSYLFTTANHLFLDDYDHQKVVLKFEYRSDATESRMEQNPEHVYREKEFKSRLEEVISDLPEKQREVFLLSRIDKMKNKEISEALDVSIKTVEKHVGNAIKSIKSSLDEMADLKL